MPIITFDSKDQIPAELHEIIKEENGKFTIDVAPKIKLAEFRDNNIALKEENDKLNEYISAVKPIIGEDPKKFTEDHGELKKIKQQVSDGKLKTSTDIETEVTKRVNEFKAEHESTVASLTNKIGELEGVNAQSKREYEDLKISSEVSAVALNPELGMEPGAMQDIMYRARGTFKVAENGKIVAKDGDKLIYGEDGVTPLTVEQWLQKLKQEAPHLAKQSSGGGASGDKGQQHGLSDKEISEMSGIELMTLGNKK